MIRILETKKIKLQKLFSKRMPDTKDFKKINMELQTNLKNLERFNTTKKRRLLIGLGMIKKLQPMVQAEFLQQSKRKLRNKTQICFRSNKSEIEIQL